MLRMLITKARPVPITPRTATEATTDADSSSTAGKPPLITGAITPSTTVATSS